MRALALALLVACGGAQKPAPRVETMAELAAEMNAQIAELARIVHAQRADCPALATQLKALFTRMQASVDRAHAAQQDPARARELTTALRFYDKDTERHTQAIAADFQAVPACAHDPAVRDVMMSMPTI